VAVNLQGRSFLKLLDFKPREVCYLLDLARDLKRAKYAGTERPRLRGKNICLIFEKPSTRTMCAFEVAAMDQGAGATRLGPSGSHLGHKESMKDTARCSAASMTRSSTAASVRRWWRSSPRTPGSRSSTA